MNGEHEDHGRLDRTGETSGTRPDAQPLGGLALAGLGFQFAASLVAFYYLGQWLDRRFGTGPVLLLVCIFGGASASFYAMYRQLMQVQRREDAARRDRRDGGAR